MEEFHKEHPYFHVGVDTAIVQQYTAQIQAMAAVETYDIGEGTFSCYVDAVAHKLAPSSYCDPNTYGKLPKPEKFETVWKGLDATQPA